MESAVLLSTTNNKINVVGAKQKGAGYTNFLGGSHTVAITTNNFTGRVYIEASLASDPTEQDWFSVAVVNDLPYVQFPRDPLNPTGNPQGDTGTVSVTFVGNYVWVRARLNRDYLNPVPSDPTLLGSVQEVLLNYGALGPGPTQILGPTGPAGPQGPPGPGGGGGQPGHMLVNGPYVFNLNADGSVSYPDSSIYASGALTAATNGSVALNSNNGQNSLVINNNAAIIAGNISLQSAGQTNGLTVNGSGVNITTDNGSNLWQFTNSGQIVLPNNGDIVDIHGVSVIGAKTIIADTAPVDKPTGTMWWNDVDGNLYIRYQDTWVPSMVVAEGSQTIISDTAPVDKPTGTMWWNDVDGNLYVRYQDSWVPSMVAVEGPTGPTGPTGPIGSTGPTGESGLIAVNVTGPNVAGGNLTYDNNTLTLTYTPSLTDYITALTDTLDSVTTRGNSTTNNIEVGDISSGNVTPSATNTYSLGDNDNRWHSLYVGPGSINLDGSVLDKANGTVRLDTALNITDSSQANDLDTGSLQVTGGAHIHKNLIANTQTYLGNGAYSQTFANATMIVTGQSTLSAQYTQIALKNTINFGSGDFISYVDSYDFNTSDTGWVDMGVTASNFNDPSYTITQQQDGYIFSTAVSGSNGKGNLVFATGGTGVTNDIIFATGGFLAANRRMHLSNSDSTFYVGNNYGNVNLTVQGDITVLGGIMHGNQTISKQITQVFQTYSNNISTSDAISIDCSSGETVNVTGTISNNITFNLTNLSLSTGQATTVTFIVNQGATPYGISVLQIATVVQTINWQGGSPPAGNASKKDVFTFSILCTAANTYTVFGQLVSFG
jgi:hypothetical protein